MSKEKIRSDIIRAHRRTGSTGVLVGGKQPASGPRQTTKATAVAAPVQA